MVNHQDYQTYQGQRPFIVRGMIHRAGIPERFRAGFDSYDTKRHKACRALRIAAQTFAAKFTPGGAGLALIGSTGCGKTHLAASIAVKLIEADRRVKWKNSAELFRELRCAMNRRYEDDPDEAEILDSILNADALFLDDLGVERPTPWVLEQLYIILEALSERNKTLIVTSNYTLAQLQDRMAQGGADTAGRVVSRLAELTKSLGDFPEVDFRRVQS